MCALAPRKQARHTRNGRQNHVRDSAAARRAEGPRGCVPAARLARCPSLADLLSPPNTGWVTSIASPVSLDGPDILLSSSRDKSVILWTLTREEAGPTGAYGFPRRALRGHAHFVQDVVISSDAQVRRTHRACTPHCPACAHADAALTAALFPCPLAVLPVRLLGRHPAPVGPQDGGHHRAVCGPHQGRPVRRVQRGQPAGTD